MYGESTDKPVVGDGAGQDNQPSLFPPDYIFHVF